MASPVPNRGPELLAVNTAFLSAAIISYFLRCFVRVRMVKAFGRDDWLMAAATLGFIAYATSSNLGVRYGTGRHREDLSVEGYQKARHCWWFCYLFYCCSMITSKLSIGYFLLRIAVRRVHIYIIYAAMMVSLVAGLAFFFVTLFQCHPISYFWNTTSQRGTCVDINVIVALGYLYSAFSIISDFTFAILPAFLVMTLQLKRRTKIALVPLLAMGCIASAAVVVRAPYMTKFRSHDFLWDTTDVAIWSTVEQGLAITAGSLATCRPLFTIVLAKLGLSSQPSGFGPYGGQSGSRVYCGRPSLNPANELSMNRIRKEVEFGTTHETDPDLNGQSQSPNWCTAQLQKIKRGACTTQTKKDGDGDSEKGLRVENDHGGDDSIGSCNDERSIQTMVERSFFVSDAERRSYIQQNCKT